MSSRHSRSISALARHKRRLAVGSAAAAVVATAALTSTIGSAPPATASVASVQATRTAQTVHVSNIAVSQVAQVTLMHPTAPARVVPVVRVTHAAKAKAVARRPVAEHTAAPVRQAAANPYAGESAYTIAEGIVPADQFASFAWIIAHESGWNVEAQNPSSGAYGLGQALPASKMAPYGPDYLTDPTTQIRWALAYMDGRYGSPNAAKVFWEAHGWY